MKTADSERFFKFVNKTESCWLWTGGKTPLGYGNFWLDGRLIRAHHFLVLDQRPPGLDVLHKCDNPSCVNPDHLFFGTQQDNITDMHRKGRANQRPGWEAMMKVRKVHFGESNHKSKLTEQDVQAIRSEPKVHGYMAKLAKRFNVTHEAIRKIVNGQSWTMPNPPR